MSRQRAGTATMSYGIAGDQGPEPEVTVAMMRVWYEPPADYRQEYDFSGRGARRPSPLSSPA